MATVRITPEGTDGTVQIIQSFTGTFDIYFYKEDIEKVLGQSIVQDAQVLPVLVNHTNPQKSGQGLGFFGTTEHQAAEPGDVLRDPGTLFAVSCLPFDEQEPEYEMTLL